MDGVGSRQGNSIKMQFRVPYVMSEQRKEEQGMVQ